MGKIIDKHGHIIKKDDQCCLYTTLGLLEENGFACQIWGCLSDLVKTMTGNSATAFNTIGEMVTEIPEVLNCSEECEFLCVSGDSIDWFVLGWDSADNTEVCSTVLKTYFSDYELIED